MLEGKSPEEQNQMLRGLLGNAQAELQEANEHLETLDKERLRAKNAEAVLLETQRLGARETDLRTRSGVDYSKKWYIIKMGAEAKDNGFAPDAVVSSPNFPDQPVQFKNGRAVVNDKELARAIAFKVLVTGKIIERVPTAAPRGDR